MPSRADGESAPWYQDLCSYKWEAIDQDNKVTYSLKLCESSPATSCGSGAAVCAHNPTANTDHTIGELSQLKRNGFVVDFFTNEECPGSNNHFQASISFQCGKTMGSPEFVAVAQCVHYFEWRTYAACKNDKFKPHKEVPCYVFGSKGKHDLNPLIKVTNGYLVDDGDDNIDFYINICRSLDIPDKSCPQGSAACLITSQGAFDMGSPTNALELLSDDRLKLQYLAVGPPPEMCNPHTPAVTITFICPSSRNPGSPPKMIAETNCRYEVEWVTEYACHRDYLESHTCKLTSEQHDVSIDLSPLTQISTDHPYYAFSGQKDSPESYLYYLNVCGKVQTNECGSEEFISSCQVKRSGSGIKKVAGKYANQTLRYSDGDLTLIYPDGSRCSSGFQRMTIINFECNKTASGHGNPVFAGETDCTYYFDWETPYACVKEKEDQLCRVMDGKKHYDLSTLTRFPESDGANNWEVVDAKAADTESKRFYLNVCHRVIQTGGAVGCPEDAAICAKDKNNKTINLGSFLSSPQKTKVGNDIRLIYTNGDTGSCSDNIRIQTILTLKCKPGDFESAPVLRSVSSDGCVYELEWYTAAACVLSKTQGDNCKVQNPQAGFSFDLSPLSKPNGGYYNLTSGNYNYYINVCGPVTAASCPPKAGVCQSDKSGSSWSLGEANSHLSYYDGLIQLTYSNGSQYNNKQHTLRSTVISFLCDPDAGVGAPEFQIEDDYTYNFRWYTSYACPERPHECLVTDPKTLQQYDLSSLSRSSASGNWQEMDLNDPASRKKYYINVCRPINPVQGCDRHASVCQMKYVTEQGMLKEVVSVSNMGESKRGPIIEREGRLRLEFTDGSKCLTEDGELNYTTHILLVCYRGTVAKGPRFMMFQNCTANFYWETRAACPIKTATNNNSCSVTDPNTGFEFNLQPLVSKTGYKVNANGKDFLVNICSDVTECGEGNAGCELDNGRPLSPVGVEKTLQYSTDGLLSLTYKGKLMESTAARDTFVINFVCDRNVHPGTLKLVQEDVSASTKRHDVLFEFVTALACVPAPVSCRTSDSEGNEYDLSQLARDDESAWIPTYTDGVKSHKFYINVCRPLPSIDNCPVGPLGACAVIDGTSHNLGYIQSTPQVSEDGSISIVYQNGDKCGESSQYSTRIIFQCDDSPGSPMFDRTDGCEYVFVWRTSEACPIRTVQGDNCRVRDPKSGYEFNLSSLKGRDFSVTNDKYTYYLSVCGGVQTSVCGHSSSGNTVSSCQVNGANHKVAGLANQVLTYIDDHIILNYTDGETCHVIYNRTTEVYFSCDPKKNPGEPQFIRETPECTYMFTWPTALACVPVKTTSCSYNDGQGHSYDLSSLAMDSQNWEAERPTGSTERYYINVCRSLVQQKGSWNCPSSAASCMKSGDQYVSLGQALSAPTMERNILKLRYTNGNTCPDGTRKSSTTINLQCDKDKVDSRPSLISSIGDCEYTFHWLTAAACPLNITQQEGCRVTNPSTGYLFDLNSLAKPGGYTVRDSKDPSKSFQVNVCGDITGCKQGSAVCINDGSRSVSGGQVSKKLAYKNGILELKYEGGDACPANSALKHSTIIHFICRPSLVSSAAPEPALIESHADTCTHYFSFHTPLVCDHMVSCAVQNGSSLIDLTPLIHWSGYYTATDDAVEQNDNSPDFYINVCRPLNPIPGVTCPPGASVCMDPDDGPPVEIGQETSGPQINTATDEVFITYSSGTMCDSDPSQNYTSKIIFTCQRGLELGAPQMLSLQDCVYLFEWPTPLVCPDSTNTSGCRLTDSQLQFTFDLSALSEEVQVSSDSSTYYINPCGSVKDDACKKSSVCEVSGSGSTKTATSLGISKAMTMDFKHEEKAILAQYGGGDACSQGSKHQSSILFMCDPSAGRGSPVLLPKANDCATTFEWKTSSVCPPQKMECKLVSSHQTFDLRGLSSLTEPWKFSYKGDSYFINLCQGIHGGLPGCPEGATVCRRHQASGTTQTLGRVYTQRMTYSEDQKKIFVSYSAGDDICGNDMKAKTVMELSCGATVGHPTLAKFDQAKCEFVIVWETRLACAVKQQEVTMENGTIHVPETGVRLSLGALYFSHHQASGDIRSNGDRYIYHIQLSGITNSSLPKCLGANICQVKVNESYRRKIGSSSKAKYYVKGATLDVIVSSESQCGREKKKMVSSTISFTCTPSAGMGIPEFMVETEECQYLFRWHTDAVCGLTTVDAQTFDGGTTEAPSLSGRSRAVAVMLSVMLLGLSVCLLGVVLYKRERRELVIQKVASCCRKGSQVSYKYSKVNMDEDGGEEEMEWLMEDLEAPPTFTTSHRGKGQHHGNGHITTKHVNTDGLRSFSLDEQDEDSEDEVLNVPGVRVVKSGAPAKNSSANRSAFLQEESDEDLVGLLDDSDRRRKSGRTRPRSHGNNTTANQKREEEDSDEDLLRV